MQGAPNRAEQAPLPQVRVGGSQSGPGRSQSADGPSGDVDNSPNLDEDWEALSREVAKAATAGRRDMNSTKKPPSKKRASFLNDGRETQVALRKSKSKGSSGSSSISTRSDNRRREKLDERVVREIELVRRARARSRSRTPRVRTVQDDNKTESSGSLSL